MTLAWHVSRRLSSSCTQGKKLGCFQSPHQQCCSTFPLQIHSFCIFSMHACRVAGSGRATELGCARVVGCGCSGYGKGLVAILFGVHLWDLVKASTSLPPTSAQLHSHISWPFHLNLFSQALCGKPCYTQSSLSSSMVFYTSLLGQTPTHMMRRAQIESP